MNRRRQGLGVVGSEPVGRCTCCFNFNDVASMAAESHEQHISIDTNDEMVNVTRTMAQLKKAAASACTICAVVLEMLVFFHFDIDRNEHSIIVLKIPIETGNPEIEFHISGVAQTAQIYTSAAPSTYPWKSIPTLPEIAKDRLTPESLQFIRECLQICSLNHPQCQKHRGPDQIQRPRRLLRVGSKHDTNVMLVEADDMVSIDPPYAALSYCWGGAVTYTATSETQHFLRHGIDLLLLPKVFVDAISLARDLGIPYIWIDALCIIQDSVEDWDTESAKMASIYSNAYLTIAASSCRSASESFLGHNHALSRIKSRGTQKRRSQPTLELGPNTATKVSEERSQPEPDNRPTSFESSDLGEHQQQHNDLGGHDARIFSVDIEPHKLDFEPVMLKARLIAKSGIHWRWLDDHQDRIPKDALSRRAWTLQEQLLSGRLLSLSSFEMQWTCREACTCECRSRVNTGRQLGRKPTVPDGNPEEIFRFWHKVIENYSIRNLTFSKDRLPAISGVAQIVQEKVKSRYLAGLWERNIDRDLLWRRTGPIGSETSNDPWAPSFSWASADGEVDYYCFRDKDESYVKETSVLAVDTIPRRQAPLGSVFEGSLKLQGPMLPGVLESSSDRGWALVTVGHMAIEFALDAAVQQMIFDDAEGNPKRTVCRWRRRRQRPMTKQTLCVVSRKTEQSRTAESPPAMVPANNPEPGRSGEPEQQQAQQQQEAPITATVATVAAANRADPDELGFNVTQSIVHPTEVAQMSATDQSITPETYSASHSHAGATSTPTSTSTSMSTVQPADADADAQSNADATQAADGSSKQQVGAEEWKSGCLKDAKSDEEFTSWASPPSAEKQKPVPLEINCWVMKLGTFELKNGRPSSKSCDQELLILGRSSLQPQLYERIGLTTTREGLVKRAFSIAPNVSVVVV